MRFDRIFFFGDSITLGCNDSKRLGWPGRIARGLVHEERHIASYNLGINGDTSLHIKARWRAEFEARIRDMVGLTVFAFGFNDASKPDGGDFQVELETSIEAATIILTEANSVSDVLWIGPTPLDESANPLITEFASWEMRNLDIARYDEAYANLALELGIDYLQLFPELIESPRYQAALRADDKVHPADDGYEMIAELISKWDKWQIKTGTHSMNAPS